MARQGKFHAMIIIAHTIAAFLALLIGALILFRQKGTALHKRLGKAWVLLILITAVSSFWIKELSGDFSWIHLLSVITIISISSAIIAIRKGNQYMHRINMLGSYSGLVIAGIFTLFPGRRLHDVLFGLF